MLATSSRQRIKIKTHLKFKPFVNKVPIAQNFVKENSLEFRELLPKTSHTRLKFVSQTRSLKRNSRNSNGLDQFNLNTDNILKIEKLEPEEKTTMPLINLKNKLNPYEADCDNIKRINQELIALSQIKRRGSNNQQYLALSHFAFEVK
jgi:hypothetical protein